MTQATFLKSLKWYHGIIFYIAINLLSGARLATREYLDSVGRPPFMPPDWAFAPVWIVLQIFMIVAGFKLIQALTEEPHGDSLLLSYSLLWAFFSMFSWFYFGLHSPILGFLTTFGMFLNNVFNLSSGFKLKNKAFAWLLTPLMIWLTLASAVAGWQMLYTPDELFGTAPFLH
jgi:tryptophan-rich sensory protein